MKKITNMIFAAVLTAAAGAAYAGSGDTHASTEDALIDALASVEKTAAAFGSRINVALVCDAASGNRAVHFLDRITPPRSGAAVEFYKSGGGVAWRRVDPDKLANCRTAGGTK